jgi:ribosomal protein L25 (general stress protein Ctc)
MCKRFLLLSDCPTGYTAHSEERDYRGNGHIPIIFVGKHKSNDNIAVSEE